MPEPFVSHLAAVLAVYELGPNPTSLPRYDGPRDWQTDAIERSIASIARRMHTAEGLLANIKASDSAGPDTKKRRSCADAPMTPNSLDDVPRTLKGIANSDSDPEPAPLPRPMSVCLDELPPLSDAAVLVSSTVSHASEYICLTCGRGADRAAVSPTSSPLPVPSGPLSAAAFESGMSAVEELILLKAQVQDVARVCKVCEPPLALWPSGPLRH